jgi:ATP/maltotriose-dependent transcriptional regulator MalT
MCYLPPSLRPRRPTYVAKLAGSLLGELRYERGQLDEAEALLEDACELGPEGGIVDFMLAAFGIGARLKFARGDAASARGRIEESMNIARELRLPRLEARLLYEGDLLAAMSGVPIDESMHGESRPLTLISLTESAMWQLNSSRMHTSDCF